MKTKLELTDICTGKLNELKYYYSKTGNDIEIYNEDSNEIFELLREEADTEMLESQELWCGKFEFAGYEYGIMGESSFTSNGIYILGRIIEDNEVERNITLFEECGYIDSQSICRSRKDDCVLEFKHLNRFTLQIQQLYMNGEIWGVYYDDNDDLVCETKSGEIINNILR